ncbi:MAG: hypothetical protein CSYNP_00413 [Syntrophus sp. SKADARSKE-3]|nr:hypothetical protein [Syntrophus sp. SKADARSKE-3]
MTVPEYSFAQGGDTIRQPLTIPIVPYLRDHRFAGKIILPAVEILQRLAASVRGQLPGAPVYTMRNASFDRFLPIDNEMAVVEACHELVCGEDGLLTSRLLTTGPIPGTTVKRTKVHAVVEFAITGEDRPNVPMDMVSALEGVCFEIPAQRVYEDLVPFGPAYRNLAENLFLSPAGAVAYVDATHQDAPVAPLGSPFPFDAALHAACAWGQRYYQVVAFPVGFDERVIVMPTVPGERYHCRVFPRSASGGVLQLDLSIHDKEGRLREMARGVRMKDVSGGRLSPPSWVQANVDDPIPMILNHCRAISVVEIRTVAAIAAQALSPFEGKRFEKMGDRRQSNFLAGRLALKYLARTLAGGDETTPADAIHTMMADGVRPACFLPNGDPVFCSLSHDVRFAFAAADDGPIGVDVERLSDRVLKGQRFYMSEDEQTRTKASSLGTVTAATRIWSIKEGVSKATNQPLPDIWKTATVETIGTHESRLTVDGTPYIAFHDEVNDHLFTLVKKV